MADNKTHSYSSKLESGLLDTDLQNHLYLFTNMNDSAASNIPKYSQINSATFSVSASKNPTGSLKMGTLGLFLLMTTIKT